MIHNVVLEKLDANMEEATIGEWRVAEGDRIEAGAPLVELITDKVTFDYECPVSGTVRRLAAAVGSVVPVGYILAQVGDATAPLPDIEAHNRALVEEHRRRQEVRIATDGAPADARPSRDLKRVRATPAARRIAKEAGIDLADLPAAAGGAIVSEEDVRAYLDGLRSRE